MKVVVGIPTLTEQGAVRTRALVDLIPLTTVVHVIDNGGHYRALTGFPNGPRQPSVAASWNRVLERALDADTVTLLLNDDIEVTYGGLNELALEAALSHSRFRNGRGPLELIGAEPHAFACFAMHKSLIDAVGYFDEQFVPAYYEDTDYLNRMALLPKQGASFHRMVDIGMKHTPATTSKELGKTWTETAANSKRLYEAKWGTKKRLFKYPYNKEPGT